MLKKHLLYWMVPAAFISTTILMYFSGVAWLQAIIAPKLNREFGLLENVQNGLLIAILAMSAISARRETDRVRAWAFSAISVVSIFLLLEELDYGLHYWEYYTGITANREIRNIHNEGYTQDLKSTAYLLIGIVFVILPLVRFRLMPNWHFGLVPSRWISITVAFLVITPEIAHFLDDEGFGRGGGLEENIGEFGETLVYYLLFLYVLETRQLKADAPEPAETVNYSGR